MLFFIKSFCLFDALYQVLYNMQGQTEAILLLAICCHTSVVTGEVVSRDLPP